MKRLALWGLVVLFFTGCGKPDSNSFDAPTSTNVPPVAKAGIPTPKTDGVPPAVAGSAPAESKSLVPKSKGEAPNAAMDKAKTTMSQTQPFDFDFKLPTIDGKMVSLSDFKGKVLIVDFWGTWCPPCRAEIPHFVALHKKYRDKGVEIVGINYENPPADKAKETIKNFVASTGITYPCVIGDQPTQARVPHFRGYPTTLFLDRTGKVRAQLVGLNSLENLEALIVTLLDEPAAPGKK